MAKLFFVGVTIVVPLALFVFAVVRRHFASFVLGVVAFVLSQIVVRIPLLQLLASESSTYQLLSATKPVMFLFLLALTAGLVEELARWILMRYLIKKLSVQSGVFFGMGHGGIEALLLIGIPVLSSSALMVQSHLLVLSGIERICAMAIHICLSLLVLIGVRKRAFLYCVMAIFIHTFINFTSGTLAKTQSPVIVEVVLVLLTVSLTGFIIQLIRRNWDDEKMDGFIR